MNLSTTLQSARRLILPVLTVIFALTALLAARSHHGMVAIGALAMAMAVGYFAQLQLRLEGARSKAAQAIENLRRELRHAGEGVGDYSWVRYEPNNRGFQDHLRTTTELLRGLQVRHDTQLRNMAGRKFWQPVGALISEWDTIAAQTISPIEALTHTDWWINSGRHIVFSELPGSAPEKPGPKLKLVVNKP